MKIGLLTAIWGRPRLTELVWSYYESMGLYQMMAVTSPEDESHPFLRTGIEHSQPNNPLSNKWQGGLDAFYSMSDPDAVIIVGSDDLITPAWIDACRKLLEQGAEYIYMDGAFFYDAPTGRMVWGYTEQQGLGRCISRSLLDRMNWQLWPAGHDRGLDGLMWQEVQKAHEPRIAKVRNCNRHGYIGLDIKTGENLWDFDHIRDHTISFDVDAGKVLRTHFPSVADELLNWNDK